MVTVEEVMRFCNNFFETGYLDGDFRIDHGNFVDMGYPIPVDSYLAISGSAFNDGVHYMERLHQLTDEEFKGRVWLLAPPLSFISLCEQIAAYDEKNPTGAMVSESFGGYSYSRGAGSQTTGTASPWQQAFAISLRPYRRMYTEVV